MYVSLCISHNNKTWSKHHAFYSLLRISSKMLQLFARRFVLVELLFKKCVKYGIHKTANVTTLMLQYMLAYFIFALTENFMYF